MAGRHAVAWAAVALLVRSAAAARVRPDGRQEAAGGDILEAVAAKVAEDLVELVLDFLPFRSKVASCNGLAVRLWGPSGDARELTDGRADLVTGVRFFPLGDRALTWSKHGTALVWDLASGIAGVELSNGWAPHCARVFPGGDRVALCTDDGALVTIWDPATGEELRRLETEGAKDVAIFPSGDRLVTWGDVNYTTLWDASSGEELCRMGGKMFGHSQAVNTAKVFPRGDRVATTGFDQRILVWDGATCAALPALFHSSWVTGMAVVRGEVLVSIGSDASIVVWNTTSGHELGQLRASEYNMRLSYRFEALGDDRIVMTGWSKVIVMDIATGAVLHTLVEDGLTDFATSPSGDILCTCAERRLSVFDTATGARLHRLAAPSFPLLEESVPCVVAVGAGAAFDPEGFGRGVSWRELPGMAR